MDLNDIGQYAPLIAIALSLMTVIVTLGKFLVKRYNEDLDNRVNKLLEKCFGDKLKELEQNLRNLRTKVNTLLEVMTPNVNRVRENEESNNSDKAGD